MLKLWGFARRELLSKFGDFLVSMLKFKGYVKIQGVWDSLMVI